LDNATPIEGAFVAYTSYGDNYGQMPTVRAVLSPSEGYHYGTVLGKVSVGTDTAAWIRTAASAGNRPTNQVVISRGA
jgi:hypothetical protein